MLRPASQASSAAWLWRNPFLSDLDVHIDVRSSAAAAALPPDNASSGQAAAKATARRLHSPSNQSASGVQPGDPHDEHTASPGTSASPDSCSTPLPPTLATTPPRQGCTIPCHALILCQHSAVLRTWIQMQVQPSMEDAAGLPSPPLAPTTPPQPSLPSQELPALHLTHSHRSNQPQHAAPPAAKPMHVTPVWSLPTSPPPYLHTSTQPLALRPRPVITLSVTPSQQYAAELLLRAMYDPKVLTRLAQEPELPPYGATAETDGSTSGGGGGLAWAIPRSAAVPPGMTRARGGTVSGAAPDLAAGVGEAITWWDGWRDGWADEEPDEGGWEPGAAGGFGGAAGGGFRNGLGVGLGGAGAGGGPNQPGQGADANAWWHDDAEDLALMDGLFGPGTVVRRVAGVEVIAGRLRRLGGMPAARRSASASATSLPGAAFGAGGLPLPLVRGGVPQGQSPNPEGHGQAGQGTSVNGQARMPQAWGREATAQSTSPAPPALPLPPPPLQLLLEVLQLADRFQADAVMQAASTALLSVRHRWAWREVVGVLDLPPAALSTSPMLTPLLQAAREAVWDAFEDLELAWGDQVKRFMWMELPLTGVEWLLAHPGLKVRSENTVFVALTQWVEAGAGASLPAPQLAPLLRLVQLPQCTSAFFLAVVVPRPWLRQAVAAAGAAERQRQTRAASLMQGQGLGRGQLQGQGLGVRMGGNNLTSGSGGGGGGGLGAAAGAAGREGSAAAAVAAGQSQEEDEGRSGMEDVLASYLYHATGLSALTRQCMPWQSPFPRSGRRQRLLPRCLSTVPSRLEVQVSMHQLQQLLATSAATSSRHRNQGVRGRGLGFSQGGVGGGGRGPGGQGMAAGAGGVGGVGGMGDLRRVRSYSTFSAQLAAAAAAASAAAAAAREAALAGTAAAEEAGGAPGAIPLPPVPLWEQGQGPAQGQGQGQAAGWGQTPADESGASGAEGEEAGDEGDEEQEEEEEENVQRLAAVAGATAAGVRGLLQRARASEVVGGGPAGPHLLSVSEPLYSCGYFWALEVLLAQQDGDDCLVACLYARSPALPSLPPAASHPSSAAPPSISSTSSAAAASSSSRLPAAAPGAAAAPMRPGPSSSAPEGGVVVTALIQLAVWDDELSEWGVLYRDNMPVRTGFSEDGAVGYSEWYPIWSAATLGKLFEPAAWQRRAYAPNGKLCFRAEILAVD